MRIVKSLLIFLSCYLSTSVSAHEADTYLDCLKSSMSGGHQFTADEVRSLCEEISGSQRPVALWGNGEYGTAEYKPANEFSGCYDNERHELSQLGTKKANEVAMIVCRYKAR